MFDKFVAGLVTSYLGAYFENVNREQVKVSLWNGHVELRDLRFRRDFLRACDTAVCVREGTIDELTIVIPWRRLYSEPAVVAIKKVRVLLQQKIAAGYNPEDEKHEAYERKRHKLDVFEAILQKDFLREGEKTSANFAGHCFASSEETEEGEAPVETRKDAAFATRLKAVILNNVQLMVDDVIVEYKGCQSSGISTESGMEPSVGHNHHSVSVVMRHFRAHGCDENDNLHFSAASERVLHKKIVLEGVQVLLNADGAPLQREAANGGRCAESSLNLEEAPLDKIGGDVSENMTPSSPLSSCSVLRHRVLSPFNAVVRLQYQPIPYHADLPMMHVDVQIDTLHVTQSREHRVILHALCSEVCDGDAYDVLLRFRPVGAGRERPTDDARAWWRYAIDVTLYRIRRARERSVFVWETYKRQKAAREKYMALFRRARREVWGADWVVALTEAEALQLRELEMELPIESIKLARRLAYHRMHIEREHRGEVLERRRQQKGNNNNNGGCNGAPENNAGEALSPVETGPSGWWGWVSFARIWKTPKAAFDALEENNPEILAEIDDLSLLLHADRWTAAQRLAIAKEFGIPEQEVETLSSADGKLKGALEEIQWKLGLRVHTLNLTLCGSDKALTPFATLTVENIVADLTGAFNRCFNLAFYADEYVVCSQVEKQPRVVSVIRAAKERCAATAGTTDPAVSLVLKRLCPDSLMVYDVNSATLPFELCLRWGPMDCNVDVLFLRACMDFARPSTSSFASVTYAHSKDKRQDCGLNPKMQRTLLLMAVEREFLCDWQILFSEVRVVVAEDERRASRITLHRLEVKNDPAKKREKLRRIQNSSGASLMFGDELDDWVNTVHATVEGATAECMMIPSSDDGAVDGAHDVTRNHWECIATLPRLRLCFKKSVMMRRGLPVPLLSASLVSEKSLQCHVSRQNLSILCTSFSLLTNFFHEFYQRGTLTPTTKGEIACTTTALPSVELFAQVLTADQRYYVEHEPLPRSLQKQFYHNNIQADGVTKAYSRVVVMAGKMIVYHAARPSFPNYLFELHRGHLHTLQDAEEVSVFVERGGVSHDCRNGVLQAKHLLFVKYRFPPLESMILLKACVEEWCKKQGGGAEAEEEVQRAFRTLDAASHTNPCCHIRLRYRSVGEAQRFVKALDTHAVGHHAIEPHIDSTTPEDDAEREEEQETKRQSCLFTLEMTAPKCTFLLYDEAIQVSQQRMTCPTHEVVINGVNFLYVQRRQEMTISFAASSLSVMAYGRDVPAIRVPKYDSTLPVMNMTFRMKHRLYPNAAWKYVKIAILKGAQVELSSELLCVVEMLWDLVGIMSNQVFGCVWCRSIPWTSEPAVAVEEKWRADGAGGLLQNALVLINMDHVAVSLYYPSDEYELAKVENLERNSVAVIKGSQLSLQWRNTEGSIETSSTLLRPQLSVRNSSFKELCPVVGPSENDSSEERLGVAFGDGPSIYFLFSIHCKPPMLSTSDFIANGGLAGYRYTHFLTLSGGHLDAVYWQPLLWDIIELLTHGVLLRATLLTSRQPYVVGSLLRFEPQPDKPLASFSWCLLQKRIELSHLCLRLPHENICESPQLWGKIGLLCLQDKLYLGQDLRPQCEEYSVQHTLTLTLEGLEVLGLQHSGHNIASVVGPKTLLKRTNFQFDVSHELFCAGGWTSGRPRRLRVQLPEDVVFQGTTNQLACFIDWMYANYMENAWTKRFVAKKVALDPFVEAYGGGEESTRWIVEACYMCFRLRDPPEVYCCVKNETSFATFERRLIDIAVVLERFVAELHWKANGACLVRCDVGEASVWHLDQPFRKHVSFHRHPSEAVHNSFRFFWLYHHKGNLTEMSPTARRNEENGEEESKRGENENERVAFRATYRVMFERGEKVVSGNIMADCIDITPVPYFLYSLKDSLFSLRFRNALGKVLRWGRRVPGILPEPLSPHSQDFSSDYHFFFRLVNVTLSRHLRSCQRVAALFFASIMAIEYVFSSGKYGVGREWSISVDSILDNGVVVNKNEGEKSLKLRPLLVRQFWPQQSEASEKMKKLFCLTETATDGLVGTLASVWIALPLKTEIYALREMLEQDGYKQLWWLGTFLEERWAWRNGRLRSPGHNPPLPIHITIETPHVVVGEHDAVFAGSSTGGRGVVCGLGNITMQRSFIDEEDTFCISFSAIGVGSLENMLHDIMQPMGLVIWGHCKSDGVREVWVRVDALNVTIEQSLYELMLHSVVRHFLATEAVFLDAMHADKKAFAACSCLPMGDIIPGEDDDALVSGGRDETNLRVHVEWDSFTMRVVRDGVGFFLAVGKVSASYSVLVVGGTSRDITTSVKRIQASLDFVKLGADGRPHLFDLQPMACTFPTSRGENEEEETSTTLPTKPRLSFSFEARGKTEEEIHVNFGKAVVFLEESTIRLLCLTLYEPYRKIVLPEYHVHEIKCIDCDTTLQERLVLSKRTKLRVVQGKYNHITIDGNGNDIHFINAGSPLLSLSEGLTLRIINARIYLYGKPIEYYMIVGSGSYVILDKMSNTIMHDLNNQLESRGGSRCFLKHSMWDSEVDKDECVEHTLCSGPWSPAGDNRSGEAHGFLSNVTRHVFANALLMLSLPEGETESQSLSSSRRPQHAHVSRSLVLLATMSAEMKTVQCNGCVTESGTFDLSEFALWCEYLDTSGSVMATRSLVSEWALTVHRNSQLHMQPKRSLQQQIEVVCVRGIEVCLRYSDVSLCWHAFLKAHQALAHIETNVLDNVPGDGEFLSPDTPPQYGDKQDNVTEGSEDSVSFSFSLRYLSLDLVDDSRSVDVPLFRVRVQDPTLPMAVKKGLELKLHISCTLSVIFYDFTSSLWRPLLEDVLLDIVLRRRPNMSLEDVKQRKGLLRVGLHFRAVRVHFSVRVVENMRRLWLLKGRLKDALLFLERDTDSQPLERAASTQQFYMYKLTQHVGQELKISFADGDFHNGCDQPVVLNMQEPVQVNFPRVEGHELPASQHSLRVSFGHSTKVVNIAKTGRILLPLGPGVLDSHMLVDITLSDGQKVVDFRTNVAFKNDLPFAMDIGGVKSIQPGEVLHVPFGCLRRRTSFTPLTEKRCSGVCSLGVSYDMLPFFYKQVFLGTCLLDHSETPETVNVMYSSRPLEEAIFFFLRFDAKSYIDNSDVLDCMGTFEAPFFIVNGTGLPMQVGLMYRRKLKNKSSFLKFGTSKTYDLVATLNIASGERCPITQVSPLMDIYMNVLIAQTDGDLMGQEPGRVGRSHSPARVHSVSGRKCDRTITLSGPCGTNSVVLHIDETKRVVTIWCPYWFVNRTPYHLKVADVRNGTQAAGVCGDTVMAPEDESRGGSVHLVNTDHMEKLGDKAVVFLCVARRSSSDGQLQWSKWSDQVPVGVLCEFGVLHSAVARNVCTSLSYTVEFVGGCMKATRVVTFSPRWVLVNHTENIIAFRQYRIRKETGIQPLLRPVELEPNQSHIIDLVRGGDEKNSIQVRLPANLTTGVQSCHWSRPLGIDKPGDRAFSLHYETRIKAQDRRCVHLDDNVLNMDDELCLTHAVSVVLMISCYYRRSTMYVVVSKRKRAPYVVENRTMYTVCVKQRDVPQLLTIYPRSTRDFAWEDFESQLVMELWATEGTVTRSKSVFINFDPRSVLKQREQLQQELHLPGGGVLFVRVRGLSHTSYAISITPENAIDAFCSLPYFQLLFRVEVDSIYALLSEEQEDFILLTVKPVKFTFSQNAAADGDGDEQVFDFLLRVLQIDDERACAKQRVVTQLADAKPLTIHLKRKPLRTTPIVYFKDIVVNLSPGEVHLEDSFLFEAMKYLERLRTALGGDPTTASWTWTKRPMETACTLSEEQGPRGADVWKERVVFIDRLLIEQFMISISLYRSPGAQNDPMWERIGYLSLFVRSVQDARLVWRRVEQCGVYETLWLIGMFYSSYYKQQLRRQIVNVMHVAGLDMMRGFVTDLLQGYFSFSFFTNMDRFKVRTGRRAEACFIADKNLLTNMEVTDVNYGCYHKEWGPKNGELVLVPQEAKNDLTGVQENNNNVQCLSRNTPAKDFFASKKNSIIEAALRLPWSVFCARVTDSDLCEYGVFAVQRLLRVLDFSSVAKVHWPLQDPPACADRSGGGDGGGSSCVGRCGRCDEIDAMRVRRFESDGPGVLPHPRSGLITWAEFFHHVSWSEFVRVCTPAEVRQCAWMVVRSLVGQPMNMVRVENIGNWSVDAKINK